MSIVGTFISTRHYGLLSHSLSVPPKRFYICVKTAADGKSNIICITSIGTPDGQLFKINENINDPKSLTESSNKTLDKLLESLLEEKQKKSETQNLGKIAKDLVLEKFTGKNANHSPITNQSLTNELRTSTKNVNVSILMKTGKKLKFKKDVNWYSCMLIKFTVESEWIKWEKNFCETFGNKGWSPIRYALGFKYQSGSLLEYALKKEKLLLEVRKTIDTGTLIDLIAAGLPNYLSDKIDRETLQQTEDLYNEIGKLEHLFDTTTACSLFSAFDAVSVYSGGDAVISRLKQQTVTPAAAVCVTGEAQRLILYLCAPRAPFTCILNRTALYSLE
ncbi:hypothetical protein HW555_000451 [Spodoptera exigua]|uniref:Uncharacterized protein n=1 Tax=Spodoptera exigua TaxID=7107 RepID=A0A835LBA3_SPOEX|nr:hypothetical protein HW555_000451 [Spodoptera exigua]